MTNPQNRSSERPWATGVLVVAGLISLSFNVRHSLHSTHLPSPLAFIYGAGPVVLAAAQSHVVAIQAARGELIGLWRKSFTFSLVIGALALSFLGIYDLLQHTVPDPIRATAFNEPAVLTPIVVDLLAIAALHELLRPAARMTAVDRPAPPGPQVVTGPVELTVPASFRPPVVTTPQGGLSTTGTTTSRPVNDPPRATPERPVTTESGDHPGDRSADRSTTTPATARSTTKTTTRGKPGRPRNNQKTTRPTAEENAQAVAMYQKSVADGEPLSQRVLAAEFNRSPGWARDRIAEAGLRSVGHRGQPAATDAVDHPADDHSNDQQDNRSTDHTEATG